MSDPHKTPSKSSTSSIHHPEDDSGADDSKPPTPGGKQQGTGKSGKRKTISIKKLSKSLEENDLRESFAAAKHWAAARLKRSFKSEKYLDEKESYSSDEESRWKYKYPKLPSASLKGSRIGMRSRGDSVKDDYDFNLVRRAVRNTKLTGGIMVLLTGCLGGGLVTMPECYKNAGLWVGVLINLLVGGVVTYNMYSYTKCAQKMYKRLKVATMSYTDLAEAALEFGPLDQLRQFRLCMRHTIEILFSVHVFSCCCVFQLLAARMLKQLVDGTDGYVFNLWPPEYVYIIVMGFLCIIVGIYTGVEVLAPLSIVLVFYNAMLAVMTMYYGITSYETSIYDMPKYNHWKGVFEIIGVSLYAFDGVKTTLVLENNLQNPHQFPVVLFSGMGIVVSIALIIGFFGYWGFGEYCRTPVILNYPWGTFSINIKMFVAMVMILNYGLNFCVPANTIWFYLKPIHNDDWHWIFESFYKILLVALSTVVACFIQDVSSFIAMTGSFCMSILGIILPPLIILYINWETNGPGKYMWRVCVTILVVLFGIVCFIGTIVNISSTTSKKFIKNRIYNATGDWT